MVELSAAKRQMIDLLKRRGPASATELAQWQRTTAVAARQHLTQLETAGLVRQRKTSPAGRGRPAKEWELTELADELFPDRHGELTVGLIEALRSTFGAAGLERVVESRAQQQVDQYRRSIPSGRASLRARVEALAKLRSAEGYVAEVEQEGRGGYLLIEHHCPICEAARHCTGLCGAELEVFQETLGERVTVERISHIISGDSRCVYRIGKARPAGD
ncbi:MAG: transcriptional regulator [Pirellulaceae bacterium]|jgi:predicted ArsR family transcriptional regulator|nr:transcriptional regulator [Pirellulaceae bacterium]MDP7015966.1 transcriptional regulator [Pirellulaceae bacterium]